MLYSLAGSSLVNNKLISKIYIPLKFGSIGLNALKAFKD